MNTNTANLPGGLVIGLQLHLKASRALRQPPRDEKPNEWIELPPLLAVTLESALDGIVTADCTGKVICYNSRFIALWGIPSDLMDRGIYADLMTFAAARTCHPDQYIEHERDTAWSEEALDVVTLKDGRVFKRQIQPQIIGDEHVIRIVSFRDVTRRNGIKAEGPPNAMHSRRLKNLDPTDRCATEVARGISAPAQYVCDKLSFLQNSFRALQSALEIYSELLAAAKTNSFTPELIARAESALGSDDLKFFLEHAPAALRDMTTGIAKILNQVRTFDESSRPNHWNTNCPA